MRWNQLKASRGVLVGRDFTRIKLDGGVFRSKNCNNPADSRQWPLSEDASGLAI